MPNIHYFIEGRCANSAKLKPFRSAKNFADPCFGWHLKRWSTFVRSTLRFHWTCTFCVGCTKVFLAYGSKRNYLTKSTKSRFDFHGLKFARFRYFEKARRCHDRTSSSEDLSVLHYLFKSNFTWLNMWRSCFSVETYFYWSSWGIQTNRIHFKFRPWFKHCSSSRHAAILWNQRKFEKVSKQFLPGWGCAVTYFVYR